MTSRLFALLFVSVSAASLLHAATSGSVSPASAAQYITATRHLPASTPLAKLELYSMQVSADSPDQANAALALEIERLYTHAKTLPSGHDRRAFETRIYLFEKRFRPLNSSFDLAVWESLRADVRAEWLSIQGTMAAGPALASVDGF